MQQNYLCLYKKSPSHNQVYNWLANAPLLPISERFFRHPTTWLYPGNKKKNNPLIYHRRTERSTPHNATDCVYCQFCFPSFLHYYCAIRKRDWKLIYNMRDTSFELYNLKNDIQESHNLAVHYSDKVKELGQLLSDKLRKWRAPMPINKTSGQPVPMPDRHD